jgi:hypothetical protein
VNDEGLPADVVATEIIAPRVFAFVGKDIENSVANYDGIELSAEAVSAAFWRANGQNDAFVDDL